MEQLVKHVVFELQALKWLSHLSDKPPPLLLITAESGFAQEQNIDLPSVHCHSHPKSPDDKRTTHRAVCLWSQVSGSVLQLRQAPRSFWPPQIVHTTSMWAPPLCPRRLTSVRHILQQPGFWLHHVPVAEEDQPPKVALVIPLHILDDVVATQRAAVLVLNSPDPDVPTHRQEGYLKEQQRCGENTSSTEKYETL